MRPIVFVAGLFSALLASNVPSQAKDITAISGRPTPAAAFVFTNRDTCGSLQYPTININPKPQNGKTSIVKTREKIQDKNDECYGKTVNLLGILYQSDPGYKGKDRFGVEAEQADPMFRSGFMSEIIDVTVR